MLGISQADNALWLHAARRAFLIVSKTLQQSWPIIHPDNDFKVSN
jgi:hypothetical protein